MRKERLEQLSAEFKRKKEEFEERKEKEMSDIENELRELGVNTDVKSLTELFKEMGLGPPYVIPEERKKRKRYYTLQKKFEKYYATKQKDVTPIQ